MSRPTLKAPSFAPILAGLLILSTVTSCTDDFPPFCPPYHVGAVEGYVREAGVGVAAEVRAVAQGGATSGSTFAVTTADSTGWYRLELPSGLYRLEASLPRLVSYSSDSRDTLRVAQGVHRFDLLRGRAEITIAMPAELEGLQHWLRLRGRGYGSSQLGGSPADGVVRFSFRLQRTGTYAMTLTADNMDQECYLPGTVDYRAADSLTVGADTVSRYAADFRALYASIGGRVTGSWQEAGRGAPEVDALANPTVWIGRAYCLSDGSFTLHFLVPREVRLYTVLTGVQQWIGGNSLADARVFALQPGDRITDVTLVESGIGIRLEGPGDLLYYRTSVVVRNEAGEEFRPYSTSANPLAVCNLRPGRYYVHLDGRCDHQIWAPQWYGGADRWEDATPVDLGVGELRQIVVDLVEGGRIAGDLLTADGSRPEYSSILLLDADDEPVCEYGTTTIHDGAFDFPGLGDGDYRLAVSDYPHDLWWWPGTYDPEAAEPITIVGQAAVSGLRWSLPPDEQAVQP